MDIERLFMRDSQNESIEENKEQSENRNKQINVDFKMVTFSLSGKDYAIDIMNVKEIAKADRFTYVPNTLPFVVGVYNLRGEIIPIIDMRVFFNIPVEETKKSEHQNLIILQYEDHILGIIVDKIDKVIGIQKSTIQPPHPLFGDINVKYIYGVVEAEKSLYVLLDIARIFLNSNSKEEQNDSTIKVNLEVKTAPSVLQEIKKELNSSIPESIQKQEVVLEQKQEVPVVQEKEEVVEKEDFLQEYKFVINSLKDFNKFYVSSVNEAWIKFRFNEWVNQKEKTDLQIKNASEGEEFLKTFWSKDSFTYWTKEYAENVSSLLPDNSAKQIVVWNPGCAKGYETYSLACVLKKRYPESKIRVYAQDIDLLNVSNAPSLRLPESFENSWFSDYLTKTVSGELTFNQEIKDSIMFEYHDCQHSNALPMVDIIFARDLISFLPVENQSNLLRDFEEKLKGNGILILGENESIQNYSNFMEVNNKDIIGYKKN